MEESIWLYFGVIAIIMTIAILTSLSIHFRNDNNDAQFFNGVTQIGKQADVVCNAPNNTMLSTTVDIPSGVMIYTSGDKVCGTYQGKVRCIPSNCQLVPKNILDLTSNETRALFSSHEYKCSVFNTGPIDITCAG